ncbi:MAG TPA: PilZ domain-containing protein [Candidatus Acidoferrales bacterium]|nr:PilZ domain-containing protein [Candidatus Acidoferrales bacterium]
MGSERRNCARRILYSPEYLDMGADNGGVVVDLSETGLRFQAVGRIEPNSDVPLSFSLGTGYRIDVEGHVVWVNPRGNSGGIAFKKLSSDSRSLIREWLSKPEAEHRAEAAVSTAESEDEQNASLPAAPQAPLVEAALSQARSTTPATARQSPATELQAQASAGAFPKGADVQLPNGQGEDEREIARIDEIPAPDVLMFHQDFPESQPQVSELRAHPQPIAPVSQASVSVAQPSAPVSLPAPFPPLSAPSGASANEPAPVNAHAAAPTPARPGKAIAPITTSIARQGKPSAMTPQRPPAQKATPRPGASFSVAPSISAWGAKGAAGTLIPSRPNPLKTGAPLFPPRTAENIFARDRWVAPQLEAESHPFRKAFFVLLTIGVLIAAALLLIAYQRGYRRQIGAVIEHVGSTVAGQSGATSAAPTAAKRVDQSANAAAPDASSKTSPGPVLQPPANTPATGAPSHPVSPPIPKPNTNFASNSSIAPANSSPAPAGKSLSTQSSQTAPAKEPPTQTAASAPTASAQPDQSGNQQAAKNPATSVAGAASAASTQPFGQAEYLRAQRYLDGSGVTRDPAQAAEWFWRSLEAGDTNAALPLADLYLHGEGVSQSCIQARILLDAAVRKGNAEAARRLGQLPDNCQ